MEEKAINIREQQWLETITHAKQSGLPIKTWCKENGVASSSFYKWQKHLGDKIIAIEQLPKFCELPTSEQLLDRVVIKNSHPQLSSALSMREATFLLEVCGIHVYLPLGISSEQITEIVRGVRNAG